ncbi:family 78 glycoside hydrolase catalytic domain [Microbacterium sp. NPDC089698]|uniref:alpha-L-rhamnosidase n=1 Tax=Microbacterium sp. NPDC089698 TaxID=3364200 RepID=UPI003822B1A9
MTSGTERWAVSFEHRSPALGVGTPRPRISWTLPADVSQQAGYEIEVTSEDGTRWIEQVETTAQTLVPWIGPDLASRDRRSVRVRVFDESGTMSRWSDAAALEAGLFEPSDWTARYITAADPVDSPVVLRSMFNATLPVVRARLYVAYRGIGEIRLNGVAASDEVLAPGWQSYHHRELYSTIDVTESIQDGWNEIEVLLGDGWFRGRLGFLQQRALYGDRVEALAQIELDYGHGRRAVFGTGDGWRWAPGPIQSAGLYDGETYDARAELDDWVDGYADNSEWSPVVVLDGPPERLEAPVGPPVRRIDTVAPVRIFRSPSGRTLVDFGQNVVGWLRLSIEGAAGTMITLRHAEVLEDGELGIRPLRSAAATDRYVLRGGGREIWEPRFTYHGFRYVEVEGWPAEGPRLDDLEAVVLHSDMERTGWFSSSHADLNQLHNNVLWSMRGNFVSIPTDCPQRDERLGWTGDISVFAPTATYLYDCIGMLRSWLRDLALEQHADGLVPFFVPDVPFTEDVKDVPGLALSHTAVWGDAAVLVPFALYRASGDLEILETQWISMKRWVDGVARLAGDSLVWDQGFQFGDWLDPTAPPDNPAAGATEPALVATAYFANSAKMLAEAANLTGRLDDQQKYAELAAAVAAAFRDRFLTESLRLSSDTQTAYAIALCFDLLETEQQRRTAAQRLVALVRESGHRIATGFVGTALILDALTAADALEDAYSLLLQTECPSWLYPVRMGATTVWERWDSMLPDGSINPGEMTSFNHYALGAVADWMHRVIGGLSSDAPGWSRIRISPRPHPSITQAQTSHMTPFGLAAVEWRTSRGALDLEVVVPPGATAVVDLPGIPRRPLGPGRYVVHQPAHGHDLVISERQTVDA